MKLRWVVLTIVSMTLPAAAEAAGGSCFLGVNGHAYLDGTCDIDLAKDGSFSIFARAPNRSRYFAYVNIDPATRKADASWNGVAGESHAHDPLGTVTHKGGCWINAHTKVCAWKPGTRPATF